MGFLAPWFLAGAVAVGLPLWLHLLRRSRTSAVPFASLMFFERRTESSVSPKRLQYLVLLALRLLVLLLLAFAFANPFTTHSAAGPHRKELVVIVVDRSFSMRAADRMERARSLAQSLAASQAGGTLIQVAALDTHLDTLGAPTDDRETVKAAIGSILPSDLSSSYAEFTRAIRGMEQNTGLRLNVHLISDFQQTSMPGAFGDLELGRNTTLTLHSVSGDPIPNWAMENVTGTMRVFDPAHTRISATVAGWQTPAAQKSVALSIDGKTIESKQVSVPVNGRQQIEFTNLPVSFGSHRAELRLEPHDNLLQDDSFTFPIERFDPEAVLFVTNGDPHDSFFFRTAMEADTNSGFLVRTVPLRDAVNEDLARYAFVVVSDCGKLDQQLERHLDEYVRRGGGLLLLAGPRTANAGRVPVIGSSVTPSTVTQGAGSIDKAYPPVAGLETLQNVQFYVASRIQPTPDARVFAKLADGAPLLVEQPWGEGRVLTFASTLDNAANDFPLHRTFVPFVVQTARYLSGSGTAELAVATGSPVELRRSRSTGAAADVIGPGGKHELSLREAASAMTFIPTEQGFYEIHRANGQQTLISAHADRRESDLTTVPAETIALWKQIGSPKSSEPNAGASLTAADISAEKRPLWRVFLVLLVGAGLMESFFAARYLTEERSAQPVGAVVRG